MNFEKSKLTKQIEISMYKRKMCRSSAKMGLSLFISALALAAQVANAFTVDNSANATQLVQKLVDGFSGITVSEASYSGNALAKGIFVGGSADGLGIESGIILSTGSADDARGPNVFGATSTPFPPTSFPEDPGDEDLRILGGHLTTRDAAILEFDFTTSANEVAFKFVFGSEEYVEYMQYNDVFGFFIDGQNIALVPGTTDPISVSTINPDVNSQYYRSNPANSGNVNVEFDGLTVVITVTVVVTPNVSHHVKLGIADANDDSLDAAVFIASLAPCFAPTVTVEAFKWYADESSDPTGTFIIHRSGSLDCPLQVYYTTSGTAINSPSFDYALFPWSPVTIPAGSSSVTINLDTWVDGYVEQPYETAILNLSPNSAYSIGSPSSGTVYIYD